MNNIGIVPFAFSPLWSSILHYSINDYVRYDNKIYQAGSIDEETGKIYSPQIGMPPDKDKKGWIEIKGYS